MSRIKVKTIINDIAKPVKQVKQEIIEFKFGDKLVNLDKFRAKSLYEIGKLFVLRQNFRCS